MKLRTSLICLCLSVTSCSGEVLWTGGTEESRLTLKSGTNPLGNWYESEGDELRFTIHRGSSSLYPGGGVGPITGLLREGLAANARGRVKGVDGCTISFQQDGKIGLVFTMEIDKNKQKTEFQVYLTKTEVRELVRVAGAFLDEKIAKHAKAEKDADLD